MFPPVLGAEGCWAGGAEGPLDILLDGGTDAGIAPVPDA